MIGGVVSRHFINHQMRRQRILGGADGPHVQVMHRHDARQRQQQGFKMIALGSDAGLLIRSLQQGLSALGRDTKPHLWF